MMNTLNPEIVRRSVLEVLEQFAMMLGDTDERRQDPQSQPPHYRASIDIHSPACLTLSLMAPFRFCEGLAANALGIETTVTEDTAQDALKELANITAGKLALDLFGNATAIPLTIPRLDIILPAQWEEEARTASNLLFNVEGTPLVVMLRQC